jgi:hypothetical protein
MEEKQKGLNTRKRERELDVSCIFNDVKVTWNLFKSRFEEDESVGGWRRDKDFGQKKQRKRR